MEIDEGGDENGELYVPKEPTFQWFYYDEEEEFDKLFEACNIKGIRERKL